MSKKNRFDFNKRSMTLFQRFIGFLNEVTEEVKEVEGLISADETGSGDVTLKYAYDDNKWYFVQPDGTVRDSVSGELVGDGEFSLNDGNVMVVLDGKFAGTKTMDEAENPIEAENPVIAQEDEEEEKKEEDKTEEVDQEDEQTEETKEESKDEEEKEGDVSKEDEIEQEGETVPFTVNGVEYLIPVEVLEYINSLSSTSEVFRKEIAQMKQRIPSAKPTTTAPIAQKKDIRENLYDRVNLFRNK